MLYFTFRKDFKNLAFDGLKFNLKEKFESQDFANLFQLATRVPSMSNFLKKKIKGHLKTLHKMWSLWKIISQNMNLS